MSPKAKAIQILKRRKEKKNMNDVNPAFKMLIQPLKNEITRKITD